MDPTDLEHCIKGIMTQGFRARRRGKGEESCKRKSPKSVHGTVYVSAYGSWRRWMLDWGGSVTYFVVMPIQ